MTTAGDRARVLFDRCGRSSLLLIVVLFLSLPRHVEHYRSMSGSDFYQYWVVGRLLRSTPGIDLYAPGAEQRIADESYREFQAKPQTQRLELAAREKALFMLVSSPLLYIPFVLAPTEDYEIDLFMYFALSGAAFLFFLFAVCGPLQCTLGDWLALSACMLGLFLPMRYEVGPENVARVQLGMLGLFIYLGSRKSHFLNEALRGFLIVGLVAFKPNVVFALPLLALTWIKFRRHVSFRGLLTGGVAAAATIAVLTRLAYGSLGIWCSWFERASRLHSEAPKYIDWGNVSFSLVASYYTGLNLEKVLSIGLLLASAVVMWKNSVFPQGDSERPGERLELSRHELLGAALGMSVFLLSSRLVWPHYYLQLIPLYVYILGPFGARAFPPVLRALAIGALVILGNYQFLRLFGIGDALLESSLCALGAIVPVALILGRGLVARRTTDLASAAMSVPPQ